MKTCLYTIAEALGFWCLANLLSFLLKTFFFFPMGLTFTPILVGLFIFRVTMLRTSLAPLNKKIKKLEGQLEDSNIVIKRFTDLQGIL